MRKLIVVACMLLTVFIVGANCYAGNLTLWGQVKSDGYPVNDATVIIRDPNFGFIAEVHTNSSGFWSFGWHNYDGYKIVSASAPNKKTVSKNVVDSSCCAGTYPPAYCTDICGTNPPPDCGCATGRRVDFILYTGTPDLDQDGVYDLDDNCLVTPNGPQSGTCISGSEKGTRCYNQLECGCGAKPLPCRMMQTDGDDDGFGDVCDDDFMGALTQDTMIKAHSFMTQGNANPSDLVLAWWVYLTTHFKTVGQWENYADFIYTMKNLIFFWYNCGYPVVDLNENNIADGEEGLVPQDWTYQDSMDAVAKSFQRCFNNE